MNNITIHFGARTVTASLPPQSTVAGAVQHASAELGTPDNLRVTVNGVEISLDSAVQDGLHLHLTTRCNEKGNN